jgi:hydrogenase nickel incorporation protein HypB
VLAANDEVAGRLTHRFLHSGTLMINLISSPGSGKTTLLEATIGALKQTCRLAALEGDVATQLDAARLRRLGIPARQILTGEACHLDARQVFREVDRLEGPLPEILFVENVGNLVCPATYDLGEDFKAALLSVVEGDDKPFKYPAIFSRAAVTVITKSDLLPHASFDLERVRDQVAVLNPDAEFVVTSAKTGEGLETWCRLLTERLAEKKQRAEAHEHGHARVEV